MLYEKEDFIGQLIYNKALGLGNIINLTYENNKTYFTVKFKDKTSIFNTKTFLQYCIFDNPNLESKLESLYKEELKQNKSKKEDYSRWITNGAEEYQKALIYRQRMKDKFFLEEKRRILKSKNIEFEINSLHPNANILRGGDEFYTHHDILNTYFNTNYKTYKLSRYKLNDNYLVWFPKESKFNKETQEWETTTLDLEDDDYGWINKVGFDIIEESNKLRDLKKYELEHLDIPYRIVFLKPYDYKYDKYFRSYIFIGIYKALEYNNNTQKFQRIETELDLRQL